MVNTTRRLLRDILSKKGTKDLKESLKGVSEAVHKVRKVEFRIIPFLSVDHKKQDPN